MSYSLAAFVFYSVLGLTIWAFIVVQSVRMYQYHRLEQRSRAWPVVQATVQKGEAVFHGPFWSFAGRVPKSLFGYSYTVAGVRYVGFFAISRADNLSAVSLQEKFNGRTLAVRYDPAEPTKSFVATSEIDGSQIHQNPNWIPASM